MSDSERIVFVDNVVVAAVKQPLVCLAKLLKGNWSLESGPHGMTRGRAGTSLPVHWSKNSLAAFMKVYQVTEKAQDSKHEPVVAAIRMVSEISDEFQQHLESPGWSLNSDMRPVHLSLHGYETIDASLKFSPEEWPYRTTLLHRGGRRYELFECGEEWGQRRKISFGQQERVATLLSRTPLDPDEVGKRVAGDLPVPQRSLRDEVMAEPADPLPEGPEPIPQARGEVRPLGQLPVEAHEHEEALEVNGVKIMLASIFASPRMVPSL